MADDRSARVREHAYRLWQQEGEPHGRDRDHWQQAEREIGEDAPVVAEPPAPTEDATPPAVPAPKTKAKAASKSPTAVDTPAPSSAPAEPAATKPTVKKPATRRKRTD